MHAHKQSFYKLLKISTNSINFTFKRLLKACLDETNGFIVIQEDSHQELLKYPSVWLRDNCYCNACFHPITKSRIHNWDEFDVNVKAEYLQVNVDTKQIIIDWSDKHHSVYDLKWLKERAFNEKYRQDYLKHFYRPKTQHWPGSDFKRVAQLFNFNSIMNDNNVLRLWLECLATYGVAIIKEAPIEKSVVRQLGNRVGFLKSTTYGEEFIVQAKADAKNVAYLSDPLPPHTDLPYYEYKPGCNLLHCMVQSKSKGGYNLLVDAFHIADRMKAEHTKDYKILLSTLVDWNDIGSENDRVFHNIWRAPVIVLDNEGNYMRINHSIPQRDSHFSVPIDKVLPWYEAYTKFVRLARNDAITFKTSPGDVLTFNNLRVLHGRTGYDDTDENVRYIVGGYLDWDIIYSKLRVLKTTTR
ncbi:gamma-butyrobetaine dioxygenase [Glossina fuscipes]|uniref:Gamma-butyrobetaine dioxygenase n=1 Tax=Glossina fuscipes TaxID=7396 RepID=A0A9C5Z3Q9_9MUSC|nr:gamma-butyrobetaine dioxygenase [Glossina fuscipes]